MFRVLSCVFTQHNLWLVGLAAVICVLSCAGTVLVMGRIRTSNPTQRQAWLMLAGLAAGGGTWATHFIAMVAYDPGYSIAFDVPQTLLSAVWGVLGAWASVKVFDTVRSAQGRILAGLTLAAAVVGLHYIGMSGVGAGARKEWAWDLVAASFMFCAAFSVLGLNVLAKARAARDQVLGCALLVLGVVSLHFTGVGALTFVPDASVAAPEHTIDRAGLALMVTLGAMAVLTAAFALAIGDQQMSAAKLAAAARMQRLADAAFEGIVMHDGKTVTDANARFAALIGRPVDELVGQPIGAFATLDAIASVAAAITNNQDVAIETRLTGPEGPIEVEIHTRVLSPGVYVSAVRDISVRLRAETAERENLAKSQFIANMSHELRTPLNAIIGYSEMISEDSTDEAAAADAKHIRSSAKHLLALINDILDLSRTEAGQVEIMRDDCDLRALLEETCALVRPNAKANGNVLELSLDASVGRAQADGLRLKQCLLNLVSNAAKFTKDGRIDVAARVQGGDKLEITVTDTGIGMTAAQCARVFEAYAQADGSIARKFGGTGLGLSITRRLARLMGGDVSVQSELGVGSTFKLTLEIEPSAARVAA